MKKTLIGIFAALFLTASLAYGADEKQYLWYFMKDVGGASGTLDTNLDTNGYNIFDGVGNVTINDSLDVTGDAEILGTLNLGEDNDIGYIVIHDAGTLKFWDDGDDTSVIIGPVANGTTELGITGSINVTGNIEAATYGSDGSISDAELLTLDNGALTEILVGGGAGSAPVWTTATGSGAPVRADDPVLGNTSVGSDSAGKNVTVYASKPTELAPALTAGNWTVGAGWESPIVGPGLIKNADGTGTQTPSAATTIAAGTTYKVVITLSAWSVGSASYTLGGVTGTSLAAATTYTDYITASTTGKLIITPTSTSRFTVSAISIKPLGDNTGDLTVEGNLVARSPIYLATSGTAYPALSSALFPTTGISIRPYGAGQELSIFNGGTQALRAEGGQGVSIGTLSIGLANDLYLYRNAANILALRNSTNQQAFKIDNTYTNDSNYERMSLTGVQGASVNVTAETAGTGGDNLDVVLTPAGTGQVKVPSANITAGSGTGITVGSAGHLNRQVYTVTTTYAAYSDADTTKGVVIATLPAKTKIVGFYADTTAAYTGGAVSAATLRVGVTAEDAAEIIAAHDVFAGAITKGLADADMGTSMTRAAQIQGGYLTSWTGTTAIYATINTTTANTNALTAGSTTFYIVTERF